MDELLNIDRSNIWHPFTPLTGDEQPPLIVSASGAILHTHDGRNIIDAISSWWVNLHGHAHPAIADAVAVQARKLEHVIFAGFTHEPAIRLAANLRTILPPGHGKIFFSDDGSTAVEVALKLAIQYWHNLESPKKRIIAIEGAYHGDTFGGMSVADRGVFTKPFFNHLFPTSFVRFPDDEAASLAQFKELSDQPDVAAFIFEPLVQGAAGMRIYRPAILDEMIAWARKKNILCVADEVFTGFGRTGKTLATDFLENKPDIIALSKGLTGGTLPLGVTSCSDRIVAAFRTDDFEKTFFHGHSYTANPLACAAANASFALLASDHCQQNIARIARRHTHFAAKIASHRNVRRVQHLGTILSVELKTTDRTSYTNVSRKRIYRFFLDRDILLRPLGNVIYVVPPYVITDAQLTTVYSAISAFLDEWA